MHKVVPSFLILVFILQVNTALAFAHRKIHYTVEVRNICKERVKGLNIEYDGEKLFPTGNSINIGYLSSNSYGMSMTIPDLAQVTWEDSDGKAQKEQVPLRSLIRFRDYFGRTFRVEFLVCKDELKIMFGKKIDTFEFDLKEIWNSHKVKT